MVLESEHNGIKLRLGHDELPRLSGHAETRAAMPQLGALRSAAVCAWAAGRPANGPPVRLENACRQELLGRLCSE